MAMRNELTCALLGVWLSGFAGCCAKAVPSSRPAATDDAPAGTFETYRVAEPEDLRLSIYGMKPADREFPYVLLTVQNISSRDVIVAYERGSLVIHCGPYVQRGPEIFERRRQILGPHGTIVFDPPRNNWGEESTDNRPELMIPIKLASGRYTIYATFEVAGPHGGIMRSDQRDYIVK